MTRVRSHSVCTVPETPVLAGDPERASGLKPGTRRVPRPAKAGSALLLEHRLQAVLAELQSEGIPRREALKQAERIVYQEQINDGSVRVRRLKKADIESLERARQRRLWTWS